MYVGDDPVNFFTSFMGAGATLIAIGVPIVTTAAAGSLALFVGGGLVGRWWNDRALCCQGCLDGLRMIHQIEHQQKRQPCLVDRRGREPHKP